MKEVSKLIVRVLDAAGKRLEYEDLDDEINGFVSWNVKDVVSYDRPKKRNRR